MAISIEQYLRMMPKASGRGLRCTERLWYPPADVYRTKDGWLVKVELAGVSPDRLEIEIQGDTLRVAGSRLDETHSECLTCHQLEITYSRFEKTIRFPCPVEGARMESRYKDGLLILHLRSAEECE
jgi:HSP20 family protein